MKCLIILIASFAVLRSAAQYTAQQPVTVAWDERIGKGLDTNADTTQYPFARIVEGDAPEQITITYQSPNSVVLSWVTGDAQLQKTSNEARKKPDTSVKSIVQYGAEGGDQEYKSTGASTYYEQDYFTNSTAFNINYTSGLIHHVPLTDLNASTQYYYRVGDGETWSLPYSFTTLQAINSSFEPYRIGVVADVGITENSTITLIHLTESLPDLVTLIGDFCYADNLLPNGSIADFTSVVLDTDVTYQPTWDQFFRLWSTITSRTPYIASNGNHEYEEDAFGKHFNSYNARYNQTSDLSGSGNSRYYSVNLPGIHYISLSPYDEYNTTSEQYAWLEKDLKTYNRSQQPWLVVQFHTPVFNSYVSHYKEVECARIAWEPIFYQYGVDLVLHGHVHSYERTNRVYDYENSECAPVYITIGDAGNLEQLVVPMVDEEGLCPAPSLKSSPGSKFQGNCQRYSLQSQYANTTNDGYCPTQQPSWSAFREPSFGHGTLDVSPTELVWNWHRNQDAEPVVADAYTVIPKANSCANFASPAPTLGASSALSPSVQSSSIGG